MSFAFPTTDTTTMKQKFSGRREAIEDLYGLHERYPARRAARARPGRIRPRVDGLSRYSEPGFAAPLCRRLPESRQIPAHPAGAWLTNLLGGRIQAFLNCRPAMNGSHLVNAFQFGAFRGSGMYSRFGFTPSVIGPFPARPKKPGQMQPRAANYGQLGPQLLSLTTPTESLAPVTKEQFAGLSPWLAAGLSGCRPHSGLVRQHWTRGNRAAPKSQP